MTTSHGQPSDLPCKYFLAGRCANGSACSFAHVSPEARPLCRFFLAGDCRHGAKCVLLHAYPTDSFSDDPRYPTFSDVTDEKEDEDDDKDYDEDEDEDYENDEEALLRDLLMLTVSDDDDGLDFASMSMATATAMLRAAQADYGSAITRRRRRTANAEVPLAAAVPRTGNEPIYYGSPSRSAAGNPAALLPVSTISPPPLTTGLEGDASNKKKDLCAFAVIGKCKFGASCRNLHGLQCPRCLRFCLHPTELEQNEGTAASDLLRLDHLNTCMHKPSREAPEASEDIECGICLEKVLSKADPRFGILSSLFLQAHPFLIECNHPFCLSCIRQWRASKDTQTSPQHSLFLASDPAAAKETIKSCPLCRELTHFIIPSSVWISHPDEKEKLVALYKRRLSSIPCKHFDFGRSECPFGVSCFYEHKLLDGSASSIPHIRSYYDQNERHRCMRETRLSDFIENALRRERRS